ncbi:MAG TPA: hypothetical protein DCY91_23965, partial [Cyanobacteria bacterium UBA11370]|nr:hypothetical protein [Cyanobacteria bacterium UBA11370]
ERGRGGGFVGDCDSNRRMIWQGIPLRRLSDEMGIVYRSAIALKLSSLWQQSAIDIAHQLMAALPGVSQDSVELLGLEFWVEVASPGWINFRLSDRALATWLQQLIQIPSFVSIPGNYLLGGGEGERG